MSDDPTILFEVATPLGFTVRTSPQYWQKIVTKHPDLVERLELIKSALAAPDEVRRSSRDKGILVFYLATDKRWAVAVARRLNGDGFLITAYQTDAIKEGDTIWHR
jgi:plasmid stabilization system protein ParE